MLHTTPLGLRLTKECLNHAIDAGSARAGHRDGRSQPDPRRLSRSDFREGVAAFLEKRPARFEDA